MREKSATALAAATTMLLVTLLLLLPLPLSYGFAPVRSFSFTSSLSSSRMSYREPLSFIRAPRQNSKWILCGKRSEEDGETEVDDDDDDEYIELDLHSDQDWRSFRARLVLTESSDIAVRTLGSDEDDEPCEPQSGNCDMDGIGALFKEDLKRSASSMMERMTPLDPSQWAYDSGKVIEQGAVILGGVEQEFGFGLRQQYFHKAAILVLDHDPNTFTKGIILNRPTDLMLDDDVNPGVKWRVWFGGDVQGLASANPDIVCLHSLKDETVTRASVPVMKDIQWTTFENAKRLVSIGVAKPEDFWVFCGYAGWGPGQLMGELDRQSWYMVATDSGTLLKELAKQSAGADPRDSGLDTWTLLMNMIGRSETAQKFTGGFDDLILKEWALKNLLSTEAGGGAGERTGPPEGVPSTQELLRKDPVDRLISRASAASKGIDVAAGMLVRATPSNRSPFLLDDQELHKSVVLILSDDENISVGVILNRPAAKGLDIKLASKDGKQSRAIQLPLRFGGQYSVKGSEPLLWLHCSPLLRAAKVGSPVGPRGSGIWKCTSKDVTAAISSDLARPEDFMVVTGVSVWTKGKGGTARGIQGEIRSGKFEVVPEDRTNTVWEILREQDVLTRSNLSKNMDVADEAWKAGAANGEDEVRVQNNMVSVSGLGENYNEEDEVVFKSNVKVSKLSDEALRLWVSTFLLGTPSFGN